MPEQLTKLRPDRDLQCYFQQPSAVAALSETIATAFTVSGCWRQQFDWAVVEWNRDNVFEHPALRNLPDGDLSGMRLQYEETRTNCIADGFDDVRSDRVVVPAHLGGIERGGALSQGRAREHATPVEGATVQATAEFELQGTPTAGDYVELAWLDQHANYLVVAGDTLESVVAGLAAFINRERADVTADGDGRADDG